MSDHQPPTPEAQESVGATGDTPAPGQAAPPAFPAEANAAPQYAPPAGPPALDLPEGVTLAPVGRRVGAWFLSLLLMIVTLFVGWFIWGAIVWSKGTSPALQVLGMRAWKETEGRPATWGTMALRNIVGGFVQGVLGIVTELISFVMFVSDEPRHRTLPDRIGSTVIVHDPGKVLG